MAQIADYIRDRTFLRQAVEHAATFATDPSTQNGALIVLNKAIQSVGANHFPRGVRESPERWERPLKYSFVEHAERNAIYAASYHNRILRGSTMYCPWLACADCARAIVQVGIVRVVGLTIKHPSERWRESVEIGNMILDEGGVERHYLTENFGITLRRDGKLVKI